MPKKTQHAVITGGTGSLGQAIAAAMDTRDWSVSAVGRKELDVTDEATVHRYFRGRPVSLLICAAGITRDAPIARLSAADWGEVWDINFRGAVTCANAALPTMLREGVGHIVFISSFSALHPAVGQAAYGAAKAALLGLVADLAARHGPSNVRVNAVLPGFLETAMTATVTADRRGEILASHTLGRFNTCHAAAKFIRFLHQDMPHTSGQVFQLDSRLNFW